VNHGALLQGAEYESPKLYAMFIRRSSTDLHHFMRVDIPNAVVRVQLTPVLANDRAHDSAHDFLSQATSYGAHGAFDEGFADRFARAAALV
jgi:hypothetical protein